MHFMREYRSAEPFQRQLADRFGPDFFFDCGKYALADQRLSGARFRAQARSEARRRTDRPVVVAAIEANPTQRRIAGEMPTPSPSSIPRLCHLSASSRKRSWAASAKRIACNS